MKKKIAEKDNSHSRKDKVYTKLEIVDFMLTISGLKTMKDPFELRILEPSCGVGDFILPIIKMVLCYIKDTPDTKRILPIIRAYDISEESLCIVKVKTEYLLKKTGYKSKDIEQILNTWFINKDFLLDNSNNSYSHIIGNPPYIRIENIPKHVLDIYRKKFQTMNNRADLYVAFYEKSLSLLNDNGKLCFICSDRWTKNTYGRQLRKLINNQYNLEAYIDLYGSDSFKKKVHTYPAITLISKKSVTRHFSVVCHNPKFTDDIKENILTQISNLGLKSSITRELYENNGRNGEPWLFENKENINLLRKIEQNFPVVEEAGCYINIGAATGCNEVFIRKKDEINVEDSRIIPVVTARELDETTVNWKGRYLINTYDNNGIVDLENFPNLKNYLMRYREKLCERYITSGNSSKWFRTIDRVYPDRAILPKLLIPDIKNELRIVYDHGIYYPNNSIYYIMSKEWDLFALRAVLISGVGKLFIHAYSTKIQHGFYRYQAQHLRKIRLPLWGNVAESLRQSLIYAGRNNDFSNMGNYIAELYELNYNEIKQLGIIHGN